VVSGLIVAGFFVALTGCRQEENPKATQDNSPTPSRSDLVSEPEASSSKSEGKQVPDNLQPVEPAPTENAVSQDGEPDQSKGESKEHDSASSGEELPDVSESSPPLFDVSDEQTIDIPDTWKRLGKNEIWIDMKNKQVVLGGYICVNAGALEMFACPAGTKEHESVVGVNAYASEMHAALLAVGAKPGSPCSWDEDSFTPASGSKIDIDLRWRDELTNEVITRSAIQMMKTHDDEVPEIEWIFGGSRFYEDPETKSRYYVANSGEMICVSNFSTAAIDINIVSSQTDESLLFWANPETTPARGTKVYLILTPGAFVKSEAQKIESSNDPAPSLDEDGQG
jgi:hypothetical protein